MGPYGQLRDSRTSLGAARLGLAGRGKAWRGAARLGRAGQGMGPYGQFNSWNVAWHGEAGRGKARRGTARQGVARHGVAWLGEAWHGAVWPIQERAQQMQQSRLFFGGIPTNREVNELMKLELAIDSVVSYEEIERLTGAKYRTNRFVGVTGHWRARLRREKGLLLKAGGGEFRVLSADGIQDEGGKRLHSIGRATGRLVRDVGMIDSAKLSTDERRAKHTLMFREAEALLDATRKSAKALLPPSPTQGVVRLRR
jgi:hypothetical protein